MLCASWPASISHNKHWSITPLARHTSRVVKSCFVHRCCYSCHHHLLGSCVLSMLTSAITSLKGGSLVCVNIVQGGGGGGGISRNEIVLRGRGQARSPQHVLRAERQGGELQIRAGRAHTAMQEGEDAIRRGQPLRRGTAIFAGITLGCIVLGLPDSCFQSENAQAECCGPAGMARVSIAERAAPSCCMRRCI